MGTIKEGLIGQCREPLQGSVHLCRGTFEQTAATGAEEGIATKQHALAVIGDVPQGMTGYMEDIQTQAMPVDLIPVIEPLAMVIRHGVMFGAIEAGMREMMEQIRDATHMVAGDDNDAFTDTLLEFLSTLAAPHAATHGESS